MTVKSYKSIGTTVLIPAGVAELQGELAIPDLATGLVLFGHATGSSKLSQRNQCVVQTLHKAGLATLSIDLLTPPEEHLDLQTGELRSDIFMLAGRLIEIIDWLVGNRQTEELKIGLLGTATGAAAAIVAAANRHKYVYAIVSVDGRTDLAGDALLNLQSPTLLIVGSAETQLFSVNQAAVDLMPERTQLAVVPGVAALLEDRYALNEATRLAQGWFTKHLH